MAGGKGKSIGGKGSGAKDSAAKSQKSHSAKAGLQVRLSFCLLCEAYACQSSHQRDLETNMQLLPVARRVLRMMSELKAIAPLGKLEGFVPE